MQQWKIGEEYEQKCLLVLKKHKYWAHFLERGKNGQPCDVIAFNDDKFFLGDVKHCVGDRFSFERIEDNQMDCFNYATKRGAKYVGFIIWFDSDGFFRWLPFDKCVGKSIHKDELITFEDFLCW